MTTVKELPDVEKGFAKCVRSENILNVLAFQPAEPPLSMSINTELPETDIAPRPTLHRAPTRARWNAGEG